MIYRIPFAIAILGIVGGVLVGILFGSNEMYFKNKISEGLLKNTQINAIENADEKASVIKNEKDKNWRYYQRFHFHSGGIGALTLALLIFIHLVSAPVTLKKIAAYVTAIGGFLYPFIWLFAAIYGPELGRETAKEKFAFFGYMGGAFLIGVILTLFMSLKYSLHSQQKQHND
jgi:hypothetical protein